MSKKKGKFDLTALVQNGYLKDQQVIYFVSDPKKNGKVTKQPNGEYKVTLGKDTVVTVHAFAQQCLGMDPPDHASKWFRDEKGATLYDLWHAEDDYAQAA